MTYKIIVSDTDEWTETPAGMRPKSILSINFDDEAEALSVWEKLDFFFTNYTADLTVWHKGTGKTIKSKA